MSTQLSGVTVNDVATLLASVDFPDVPAGPVHRYLELLLSWNRRMNLVGSGDWRTVLLDLILDSFHLAAFLQRLPLNDQATILDLGAGAGLPGIPLRMVWTAGTYRMVEVRQKRQAFLAHALGQLQLPRTVVFSGTAEAALGRFGAPAPVELVVSRAFKPWPEVLSLVQGQALRTVFMANEPPPAAWPAGWTLDDSRSYCSGLASSSSDASLRWLWLVSAG
ncbi:MAG: class I SAM-dependent methyltransferase [Desulfovibrio sp.]|nr:class I SAM-dependent methyltransferase [Desulfovibrio sp.]